MTKRRFSNAMTSIRSRRNACQLAELDAKLDAAIQQLKNHRDRPPPPRTAFDYLTSVVSVMTLVGVSIYTYLTFEQFNLSNQQAKESLVELTYAQNQDMLNKSDLKLIQAQLKGLATSNAQQNEALAAAIKSANAAEKLSELEDTYDNAAITTAQKSAEAAEELSAIAKSYDMARLNFGIVFTLNSDNTITVIPTVSNDGQSTAVNVMHAINWNLEPTQTDYSEDTHDPSVKIYCSQFENFTDDGDLKPNDKSTANIPLGLSADDVNQVRFGEKAILVAGCYLYHSLGKPMSLPYCYYLISAPSSPPWNLELSQCDTSSELESDPD